MRFISKKIIFSLIATFLVFIICLLIAETVIRIDNKLSKKTRKIWIPDPFIGHLHSNNNEFVWENKSNEEFSVKHKTNSFGFIGDEISKSKPKNTYRIIILGDSFTEALQIDKGESFCKILEELLNNSSEFKGHRFEVLNAGISGYSPIMHYQFFKRKLMRLEADLVISQLWTNDIFEDSKVTAMSVLDKDGLPIKTNRFFFEKYLNDPNLNYEDFVWLERSYPVHQFMMEYSRFYEYFYSWLLKLKKNNRINKKMRSMIEYDDGHQFFVIQNNSPLFAKKEYVNKSLGNTQRYVKALKDAVESSGAEYMMFYIPHESQLKFDLEDYSKHTIRYFNKLPASTYINDFLDRVSNEGNILYLDLLQTFEQNKEKRMYIDFDGHLNQIGHKVVAYGLYDFIKMNIKSLPNI